MVAMPLMAVRECSGKSPFSYNVTERRRSSSPSAKSPCTPRSQPRRYKALASISPSPAASAADTASSKADLARALSPAASWISPSQLCTPARSPPRRASGSWAVARPSMSRALSRSRSA
jgi:hypothetical protein